MRHHHLLVLCILLAASVSACCRDEKKAIAAGEAKSSPAAAVSTKRAGAAPLTSGRYCRLETVGSKRSWTIVPAKLQDFVTAGTTPIDFYIPPGRAINNYANSRIKFADKDYVSFDVAGDPDTLVMTHTSGANKYVTYIANTSSNENLWFEGIHVTSDGRILGTYFVYRMPPDKPCEHPKSDKTKPCPGVHVEFFDTKDAAAYAQRPLLGTNVFPSAAPECPAPESGEGDGDEGAR